MNTSKLADWSEILASIAVVVSLVFLLQEVRLNTRAIERQSRIERTARLTNPVFESPELRSALQKVADVDGLAPILEEYMASYGMSEEEALVHLRHLTEIWLGFEADYEYGNRDGTRRQVETFLEYPDNQIFVRSYPYFGAPFEALVSELLQSSVR